MIFKFSKEFLENYTNPTYGYFESCALYSVYQNQQLLGTFLLGEQNGFIDVEELHLKIDIVHRVIKSDSYKIVNSISDVKMGE